MNKYLKIALFGFLTWVIPFAVAIGIFPLRQNERPLFESIMPVVVAACAVGFGLAYLRKVETGLVRESALLGAAWLGINLALDLLMFMQGPMRMSLLDYVKDIGVTYLMIPAITVERQDYPFGDFPGLF